MQTHIILLCLFYAKASLGQVERYEAYDLNAYSDDETVQVDDTLNRTDKSVAFDAGNIHSAESEEAEVILGGDGKPRDKRTLGFILGGLASALGYTLTPLQVASLPNPTPPPPPAPPAPRTPVAPPKAPAPPPPAPRAPPAMAPAPAPAPPPRAPPSGKPPAKGPAPPPPPPPPRQRETIRITGLVNFGPNANANIPTQLGQYEQLFHGNAARAAPAAPARPPAPAPAPAAAPAPAPAPIPKPTLVRIPIPIVPNLSPLLPPSRPPVSMPSNTPAKPRAGSPAKQEVEIEYRKLENLEKFNVENEEIEGDKHPFIGLPVSAYAQEPNWEQGHIAKLQELEERQKEYADRLAKHEALLLKQQQDHENTDDRFVNREKEITDRDEAHAARLRDRERQEVSQDDEERPKTDVEDSKEEYEEDDRPSKDHERPSNSESDEEHPNRYEDGEERSPKQYFEYDEEPKKYLDNEEDPQKYGSYGYEDDEMALPISRDKEISKSEDVRNSYGESLEDDGKIHENIADYFIKFKDPQTGLYVPEKTQNAENYNKDGEPWWKGKQDELDGRLHNLREEYSLPAPESKYEEYELEEEPEASDKPAEELKSANDEDERNPEPNNFRKIPDYSEAFGSYQPYVRKLESEVSQEIVSPTIDTAQSPRSESEQASKEESQESEKSEDQKDIPLYHFDFKSFTPYYSPIKYLYSSDDAESSVPEIHSYNQNSQAPEGVEATKTDEPIENEEPNEKYRPTIGLPEKLTMKNLHDGESKQVQAWPAPFDYVFDSTEQTNIAELPRIQARSKIEVPTEPHDPNPSEKLEAEPVGYAVPAYDAMFGRQRDIRQHKHDHETFPGYFGAIRNLEAKPKSFGFQGYSKLFSSLGSIPGQSQLPVVPADRYNSQDNRQINREENSSQNKINSQRNPEQPKSQNRYYIPGDHSLGNHRRVYDKTEDTNSKPIRTTPSSSTEETNHPDSRKQYQPVESHNDKQITHGNAPISKNGPSRQFGPGNADLRNRGHDFSPNYAPAEPRLSGRRFDESPNHQMQKEEEGPTSDPEDKSLLKFYDPKSAHDFFGFSNNDYDFENNKNNEKSQSVPHNDDELDLLEISNPFSIPYQYDVKLTEYTDEPESDTEKVKVKEYRNQIATVTISEKKQLSPEDPVRIIGYSQRY